MVTRDYTADARRKFLTAMAALHQPRRITVQSTRNCYVLVIAGQRHVDVPHGAVRSWEKRGWIVWHGSPEKGRKTYEVSTCEH